MELAKEADVSLKQIQDQKHQDSGFDNCFETACILAIQIYRDLLELHG